MAQERNESEGGIVLPEERQFRTSKRQGTVEAVGPKVKEVAVGDEVYLELQMDEDFVVVDEREILCKVVEK